MGASGPLFPGAYMSKLIKNDALNKIKERQERDEELVVGVFKNNEVRGGSLSFRYKAYKGQSFDKWILYDGERHQIPRGLAKHLNNNCFYYEYQRIPGGVTNDPMQASPHDGRQNKGDYLGKKKVHRFEFHSLEFTDDEYDTKPDIMQVTHT